MKKLLTITISILMIGALLTGCGTKPVATQTKPATQEVTAPQVDDNGNKLTDEQQKEIADHAKISTDITAKSNTWIKVFTTITPQNSAQVFDKLNAMSEKPYLTDAFKKAYFDETLELIKYDVTSIKFETLTDKNTGKNVDGAVVYYNIDLTATGIKMTIPSRLTFVQNAKGDYKVADYGEDKPIIK